MTEYNKEVYQKGVAYLEEWEDVNYCEHDFKFKDEWLTDKEVVDKLNELYDENEQLKQLAEGNEESLLTVMTYLHDNYYDIWEKVNKECFDD